MKKLLLWVTFAACSATTLWVFAEEALPETLRGTIFSEAESALKRANEVRAAILAPTSYSQGAENFKRAEAVFAEGGKLERLRELLKLSTDAFESARVASEQAAKTLESAYQARLDAESAGAKQFAAADWKAAELEFYEAVSRLEAGKTRRVERYAKSSEDRYREAELGAIQKSLLDEIETLIAQADDADARRNAPQSFAFATQLLDQAKQDLRENRYDTDRPRTLAGESLHYARHALYVSKLVDSVEDGEMTFETVLMDWERQIESVASELDLPVFFDSGPAEAVGEVKTKIVALQKEAKSMRENLSDRDAHVALLENEVARLQQELGGEEARSKQLDAELARQQRRVARIQNVEQMFSKDEAQVLRDQDRLVLRMIGLNFASGSSTLGTEHGELLTKLQRALTEFPESPVVIEGHTDSYGADETNQSLSTARAEALAEYLLENEPISPALLTSIGFGETKPVANNETADGRRKNRRIDVVIYPVM